MTTFYLAILLSAPLLIACLLYYAWKYLLWPDFCCDLAMTIALLEFLFLLNAM